MVRVTSGEFDLDERAEIDVLRSSVADSQDQLRRARARLERAQRRVKNLEVAFESWTLLLAQYEETLERGGPDLREPREIRI
jgi:multidrug resistance efflux pump